MFQTVWFAAVLWGNVIGLASLLCFGLVHFLCVEDRQQKKRDLFLALLLLILGFAVDSGLGWVGILQWESASLFPMPWLSALWLGFALTIYYGLGWIAHFPKLGVVLGAVCGSLSYLGGAHLSPHVSIHLDLASVLVLSSVWALMFGLLWQILPRHLHQLFPDVKKDINEPSSLPNTSE